MRLGTSKNGEAKKQGIEHVTPKGLQVKLVWEKEYSAYRLHGDTWLPMMLGSASAKNLIEYIDKNF